MIQVRDKNSAAHGIEAETERVGLFTLKKRHLLVLMVFHYLTGGYRGQRDLEVHQYTVIV